MLSSFPSIAWLGYFSLALLVQISLLIAVPTKTLINHKETHHGQIREHTVTKLYIHIHEFITVTFNSYTDINTNIISCRKTCEEPTVFLYESEEL
jgi:hypothetical protein